MKIATKAEGDHIVATVTGEIDGKTAPQVQSELLAALQGGNRLVVDMTGVSYLSSAGLRMLLLLYRQVSAKNGKIVLLGVSEEIRDTMAMTGFINFFPLADSQGEVASALS